MSRTPDEVAGADQAADYLQAWQQILTWTEQGKSWSGKEKHCCFLNIPGKPFADISIVSGINFADDGRGIAVVDWDHDGRQDFWVSAQFGT